MPCTIPRIAILTLAGSFVSAHVAAPHAEPLVQAVDNRD